MEYASDWSLAYDSLVHVTWGRPRQALQARNIFGILRERILVLVSVGLPEKHFAVQRRLQAIPDGRKR